MELPTPAVRFLGPADRDLLTGMLCSTGVWFEDDVEAFIRTRLADHHNWRRAHTDHTIVGLELDGLGLIAVGSHESDFVREGGQVVTSTYLECAAVRIDFQGAVLAHVDPLDGGDRPVTLGRYLLEVLLSDIAEREQDPIIRAVVARENIRSLRLCTRIGLTDERDDPDDRSSNGSDESARKRLETADRWTRSKCGIQSDPHDLPLLCTRCLKFDLARVSKPAFQRREDLGR